ncbi:UDP-glucose--hexose-1-phosphate uridylyltransferase [Rhizosphaericola mali]|uniref:Galactose-1-phosphate uridylyltransferase n=1 Tax=Rhizosphaericola mali TaxID=2545455 RepID=A0A5P2G127_9BACT|nr:UDP-glucose--hexose-1-phosphate uridylyltransferase [Rhizosphaericola mali]QES87809.1 UDP-glucose--hexose-1-phosphate uridylyltransferase [Rhizosphaericola mali]
MEFNYKEHPHNRFNLLTGEWVLVSPHRTKRPWNGKVEDISHNNRPPHDPNCYLCAGNTRADGSVNPDYKNSFVFVNDYSALLPDTPDGEYSVGGLLKATSQKGICKVISFSPRHDLTLAQMEEADIKAVVDVWQSEFNEISKNKDIKYIQIFENKGEIMGCSNPHPHGQIWSLNSIPVELHKETIQQENYFKEHGKSLLSDYIQLELEQKERILFENDDFVCLIPFWAVWPYETMIVSKRQIKNISDFSESEKVNLANIIKKLTSTYDKLFNVSFPYSAGMHQMPVNSEDYKGWHWHMHFYPPLLRSATIKKFMVGYELLANPQRDITAEAAATTLKNL